MKISKIFLTIFLLGFLLFGFLYVRNSIRYEKEKAVWEARVEVLLSEIGQLEQEISVHLASADKWRDRAFEKVEELRVLERKLEEAERRHDEVLASIAELAPDELVVQARYFLSASDDDIVLTSNGVVFSIQATRQLVTDLTDYEFVIAKKIPSLNEQLEKKDGVIANKDLEIGDLRTAVDKLIEDRDKWEEMYQGEHNLRLSSEKKHSLFSVQNIVTGTVVAVVVGGLILVLK